jgi:hypothetical protein
MSLQHHVFVGWDPREPQAYDVCAFSIRRRASVPTAVAPVRLADLRAEGLYTRPTETRDGVLWDVISEAPMSTEFAISRFFVPLLARRAGVRGWVAFCDCDFLFLADVAELFRLPDDRHAVACVQHDHRPSETVKMDGQVQTRYARKNWSSMMLFNVSHPANERLTLEMLNGVPGRDLHRFCWLEDHEIGAVPVDWNWLEGTSPDLGRTPKVVHYTRGGPWMDGWEDVAYAQEWLAEYGALTVRRDAGREA